MMIDKDALLSDIERTIVESGCVNHEGEIMDCIRYASEVDTVPVVRGEWILQGENEHDYETSLEEKCSLCGRCVYRYDTQPQDNYCPNCGAKMDGKDGDSNASK